MRKWHKGLLWAIAGMLLALAAAAILLHALTDSTHLKERARDQVKQQWSRELTIADVSLKLLPYPQLHAKNITLSNPTWAPDKHLLEAGDVKAQLAFLPLLRGKIVVKGLHIEGLHINLNLAQDGKRSWDFSQTQDFSPSVLTLTTLVARNSSIRFRNAQSAPAVWQVPHLKANGRSGLRQLAFELQIARNHHLLQLDGKLDDLSSIGRQGASSQGVIQARAGAAAVAVSGKIPLDFSLQNFEVLASIEASSMQEIFGFLDIKRASPAALQGSAVLRAADKKTDVSNLKLQLGQLNLSGNGQLDRSGSRPVFNARLQADHIDMVQTFLDAGQPPLPPKKAGQLFRDTALAWPLLLKLTGMEGRVDARIDTLKLRSGIEVKEAAAQMTFHDDRMTVESFSGKLLGGSANGDAALEASKKNVRVKLKMNDVLLQQWFRQTGKKIEVTGGAMMVDAQITAVGPSMNDLAATMSGPVHIKVGAANILSPEAGSAEFWLTGLLSAKDSNRINLSCISARLPFRGGVARGEAIAGARSDASQLLTRGEVDLRNQTLDLRGRVRARAGINLGISTFSGDVKITGKLVKPELQLDQSGAVGAIARIGAAILTSGVSVLATAIWDGANPESDPCQVVFSNKAKAADSKTEGQSGR